MLFFAPFNFLIIDIMVDSTILRLSLKPLTPTLCPATQVKDGTDPVPRSVPCATESGTPIHSSLSPRLRGTGLDFVRPKRGQCYYLLFPVCILADSRQNAQLITEDVSVSQCEVLGLVFYQIVLNFQLNMRRRAHSGSR